MAATPYLKALEALELSARTGSLSAAADVLAITPAAVGQRIRALEEHLGFALLARGRSGVRPTAELDRALPHLAAGFRALGMATEALDFQRAEEIHIVADSVWADLWLAPRLARFKAGNPQIRFCVNGEGEAPLRLGQADCEIWLGPIEGGSGAELLRDYLLPVSSPENTRRISRLPKRRRLEGFPLLHLQGPRGVPAAAMAWPAWIERYGYRRTAADRGIRYARLDHALDAVRSDAGILLCGLALILDEVEAGRLSLPFPAEQGEWGEVAYQVRFRGHTLRRAQVRRFRDWLASEARDAMARLARLVGDPPPAG